MAGALSHMWYVKTAGRIWGPYPETRLGEFVREGRVGAATPVSPFSTGPFAPAAANPEFAALMRARAEAPPTPPPAVAPTPAAPRVEAPTPIPPAAPAPVHAEMEPLAEPSLQPAFSQPGAASATVEGGPVRPLLVWAELSGETLRTFPAALAVFGPGVGVRPGLWLIQARMGPAALRNLLSRRLGASDTLMVVEAPLDQVAWFNVEPTRDRELRRLWSAMKTA